VKCCRTGFQEQTITAMTLDAIKTRALRNHLATMTRGEAMTTTMYGVLPSTTTGALPRQTLGVAALSGVTGVLDGAAMDILPSRLRSRLLHHLRTTAGRHPTIQLLLPSLTTHQLPSLLNLAASKILLLPTVCALWTSLGGRSSSR
jgi:hypothetical protein